LTKLRRTRIGFVFQAFNLVPALTVRENILLPSRLAHVRPDRRYLADIVSRVGLDGRLRHRPAQLSGGEQQRVPTARALPVRPDVIFCDEPTGALDTRTAAQVLTLLRQAVDIDGRTVVMVTHDPVAASYAERVVLLADGRIALWFAVVIVTACGAMLESGMRHHGPVQRYAAAPVLVATTDVTTTQGSGDQQDSEATALAERGQVDPSLVARIEAAPGVPAAMSDSVPTRVIAAAGVSSAEVHPWSAAQLTPFALQSGSAPVRDDQAVVDAGPAARVGARIGQPGVAIGVPRWPER